MSSTPSQLSFLPDDYLERKAQRRTNVICAILFVLVIGAIGAAFTFIERQSREIEEAHAAKFREFTEEAKRIEQARQMQDKQRKMAHHAELTASLLERVPRSFVLAELTNNLPSGVSLLDFAMESTRRTTPAPVATTAFEQRRMEMEAKRAGGAASPIAAAPEAVVYDVKIRLTGVAATDVQVAQFIGRLNHSKLLRDVNLLISDEFTQDDQRLRKFQIEMSLDPAASVEGTNEKRSTAALELK